MNRIGASVIMPDTDTKRGDIMAYKGSTTQKRSARLSFEVLWGAHAGLYLPRSSQRSPVEIYLGASLWVVGFYRK